MTSLQITEASIPSLTGKVAVITGGASGIGYATALILANRGAKVFILDLNPPQETDVPELVTFKQCNVAVWAELSMTIMAIGPIDMVFANAGISERPRLLEHELTTDENGSLVEPTFPVLDVNFKSVLNLIKLSWTVMKGQKTGGSIVLTASSSAYAPEAALPIYSSIKLALIGLVRSLRSVLPSLNITINAVAPAVTYTPLVPSAFTDPIAAANLPICSAHMVGLALAYSATAMQSRRVEAYGKEREEDNVCEGRWNGRVILTMGERYTELEGPIAESRGVWMGKKNEVATRAQQAQTDFRWDFA